KRRGSDRGDEQRFIASSGGFSRKRPATDDFRHHQQYIVGKRSAVHHKRLHAKRTADRRTIDGSGLLAAARLFRSQHRRQFYAVLAGKECHDDRRPIRRLKSRWCSLLVKTKIPDRT